MLNCRVAAAVASLLAGASAASAGNFTTKCPDGLQMIIARGTGEDAGPGVTGAIGLQIAKLIEGSAVHAIDYPASFDQPSYFISVSNGTAAVRETLKTYTKACPDTKLALFGYSQGAQITTNTLCGMPDVWAAMAVMADSSPNPADILSIGDAVDEEYTKNIVSVVLFGDPTHQSDAPYNHGTGSDSGVFYRADHKACDALGNRIRSYCDTGDPYCDVASTTNLTTHGVYVQTYHEEVIKFVVDRYTKSQGGTPDESEDGPSPTQPPDSAGAISFGTISGVLVAVAFAVGML